MTGAIQVEELVRTYGNTRAVDGLSIVVREGEVYGFIGPNGAGKTTTLRILSTLLAPTSGKVTVAGIDIEQDPHSVRRLIGVALQESGLDGMQTSEEILAFHGRLQGLRGKSLKRGVERAIACLGVEGFASERISTLSGGMKRRLDIAIALVHSPAILFLDEPTVGMDPTSRRTLWDEIRRLRRDEGTTVFLTTQYLDEADQLADRIGIIAGGQLKAEGSPADLKKALQRDVVNVTASSGDDADAEQIVKLTENDEATISAVHSKGVVSIQSLNGDITMAHMLEIVASASIGISDISLLRPTLDDVFIELTSEMSAASTVRKDNGNGT